MSRSRLIFLYSKITQYLLDKYLFHHKKKLVIHFFGSQADSNPLDGTSHQNRLFCQCIVNYLAACLKVLKFQDWEELL